MCPRSVTLAYIWPFELELGTGTFNFSVAVLEAAAVILSVPLINNSDFC